MCEATQRNQGKGKVVASVWYLCYKHLMSVLNVGSKFGKGSFEKLSGTGISIPSLPRHRRRDRKCFARDLVSRDLGPPVHRFWWDTGTFKGDFTCAKQYAGKWKVLSWSMSLKQVMTIAHFTVVCLVARPRNSSKAGCDHSLIHTSLLFTFKWKQLCCRHTCTPKIVHAPDPCQTWIHAHSAEKRLLRGEKKST